MSFRKRKEDDKCFPEGMKPEGGDFSVAFMKLDDRLL